MYTFGYTFFSAGRLRTEEAKLMNTDSERKMTMRFHTAILFPTRNWVCAILLWLVAGGAIAGFVAYSESAAAQVDSLEDFCDLLMVGGARRPQLCGLGECRYGCRGSL